MKLDDFYQTGGITRFIDRISSALGIHASRVKMVRVWEGSVIIDFMIVMLDTLTPEEAETEKAILETDIIHQITEGIIDLGAPILGATTAGKLLVGDPIPPAPAATNYGHGVP